MLIISPKRKKVWIVAGNRSRSTTVADPESGFEVTLTFDLQGHCTGFAVSAPLGQEINSTTGRIRLGSLIKEGRRIAFPLTAPNWEPTPITRRSRQNLDVYLGVARAYAEACASGDSSPIETATAWVTETTGVHHSAKTVKNWINVVCRKELKLLTSAPGMRQPGGELTDLAKDLLAAKGRRRRRVTNPNAAP